MIALLVQALPEIYQPIFGHPQFSPNASRPCSDRLEDIAQTYDALQSLLGRPLRVLDLGCAQGFFSLSLAARGAHVHGVDYLDRNIAVCQALASENPQLHVTFETGRIEDVVRQLPSGEYDLILALSVFHHVVHEHGVSFVQDLFQRMANQCGVLIAELALREEPLYWGASQPEDPKRLLEAIAFVHESARHGTHLAQIARPLYIASDRYWVVGQSADYFKSFSTQSHALAHDVHEGSRRYFFSDNAVLKQYQLKGALGTRNREELSREIEFLTHVPDGFFAPQLFAHGLTADEGWTVSERIQGRPLLDMIREGVQFDAVALVYHVLTQLTVLERVSLFHEDLRTWNVLVNGAGYAQLIDFGSITPTALDCTEPLNIFQSFLIFVSEVASGKVDDPSLPRIAPTTPYSLPEPFQSWLAACGERPVATWSFQSILDSFVKSSGRTTTVVESSDIWAMNTEQALQSWKYFSNHNRHLVIGVQQNLGKVEEQLKAQESMFAAHTRQLIELTQQTKEEYMNMFAALTRQLTELTQQAKEEHSRVQADRDQLFAIQQTLQSEAKGLQLQVSALKQERDALLASMSWKVTAPLRGAVNAISAPVAYAMSNVLKHPRLSERVNRLIGHVPWLHTRLRRTAISKGMMQVAETTVSASPAMRTLEDLSPRAKQIYLALELEITRLKA